MLYGHAIRAKAKLARFLAMDPREEPSPRARLQKMDPQEKADVLIFIACVMLLLL
jgi:hypothetical protein